MRPCLTFSEIYDEGAISDCFRSKLLEFFYMKLLENDAFYVKIGTILLYSEINYIPRKLVKE